MKRRGSILLGIATLAFIASTVAYALIGRTTPSEISVAAASYAYGVDTSDRQVDLGLLFLRPEGPWMAILMVLTWIALTYHALRRLIESRRVTLAETLSRSMVAPQSKPMPSQGPPTPGQMARVHRHDDCLPEHLPLIIGLVAGALWPWLLQEHPLPAFLLSVVMLIGFLAATVRGVRFGNFARTSSSVGFATGWALMVVFATFVSLLQLRLSLPPTTAAMVGLLLGALAAFCVQLRIGPRVGFSVAVILGLVGIAAGTIAISASIATATVLAIAIIGLGLVSATT